MADGNDQIENWFKSQREEWRSSWVVFRNALRLAPFLVDEVENGFDFQLEAFVCLRFLLTAFVDINSKKTGFSADDISRTTALGNILTDSATSIGLVVNVVQYSAHNQLPAGMGTFGPVYSFFNALHRSELALKRAEEEGRVSSFPENFLSDEVLNDISLIDIANEIQFPPLVSYAGSEGWKLLSMSGFQPSFWPSWIQGFLDGKPLDWELQRRVALIPDADWEKGPEHIAEKIEEIRAEYEREIGSGATVHNPKPVSQSEIQAVKERVSSNRHALALSIASLLEQIAGFREHVRGLNHLAPEFKQELLDFIDALSGKLDALLHDLPEANEQISDEKASGMVLWLREFKPLVLKDAAKYVAPKNVAEASVPTGIILGCTGVGSMIGGPAGGGVGALVGSLITGQIKPAKAAEELTQPHSPDTPPSET